MPGSAAAPSSERRALTPTSRTNTPTRQPNPARSPPSGKWGITVKKNSLCARPRARPPAHTQTLVHLHANAHVRTRMSMCMPALYFDTHAYTAVAVEALCSQGRFVVEARGLGSQVGTHIDGASAVGTGAVCARLTDSHARTHARTHACTHTGMHERTHARTHGGSVR